MIMDMDAKLDKKFELLVEKREKHKLAIQIQTEQLKKVNEEIDALEMKKNDRLMKTLFLNLQKEGLDINKSMMEEVVTILKTKQNQNEPTNFQSVIISNAEKPEGDTFVPTVPDAFR